MHTHISASLVAVCQKAATASSSMDSQSVTAPYLTTKTGGRGGAGDVGNGCSEILRHKQKSDNYLFMRDNKIYTPKMSSVLLKKIIYIIYISVLIQ